MTGIQNGVQRVFDHIPDDSGNRVSLENATVVSSNSSHELTGDARKGWDIDPIPVMLGLIGFACLATCIWLISRQLKQSVQSRRIHSQVEGEKFISDM